jgi:type I restriction enzyme, S subunit
MNQGRNLTHTKERITAEGVVSSGIKEVTTGTLLLSYKLSIGKVGITQKNLYTNEAIAALPILDSSVLDINFLYWALKTIDLLETSDKAAMGKTLNKAKLRQLQIPLPPLEEQKRIAGILDAADILRAKRREALARLDDLLQSTFLDLFGDPVINPKCPAGRLGDHLTFVTSGGRGWAKYYCDRGARFVRSLDVQMNSISSEEEIFVDPPENAEAKRTRVKADDVLLTITGSRIGRVARAPETLEGAFISQHVAILRLGDQLMPEFVARFLSLEGGGQIQIGKLQYGQTKPGLNFRQIRSFQVPIPAIEEQRRFAEIVSSVEEQKAKMRKHLEQLDDLFASLQQRAFRGDL